MAQQHGIIKINYSDGSCYVGQVDQDEQKHGLGTMEYPDGSCFIGEWKNDQINGKGKMIYANGGSYEGDWKDSQWHGEGHLTHNTGHHDGAFKEGKKHGKGKMTYLDGKIYEGDWKENLIDGMGKMIFSDGSIYEGEWKGNKKDGKAKMTYSDGRIYIGDWKENLLDGMGIMIYSDGSIYEGEWKGNKKDGKGKMIFSEGKIYEGDWKEDLLDGMGKMIYTDGSIYEGEWKKAMRDGKGKMTFDGAYYEGDWKEHFQDGIGKMVYPEGDMYIGEWKKGKRDGKGKSILATGQFDGGSWKANRLIKSTKIRIKVKDLSNEQYEMDVLSHETVYRVMEIISQKLGIEPHFITIFLGKKPLRPNTILSNVGINKSDILWFHISNISKGVIKKLVAYLHNDEENAITQEQFLSLPPKAVINWIIENRFHDAPTTTTEINTIQQGWELMKKQRLYRGKQGFPSYWIDIFANLVLDTGFKFISLPILGCILNALLKRYGYRGPRLQKTKDCILQVMEKYESSQFHDSYGKPQKMITFEGEPNPRFTDGKKFYEASTILEPIANKSDMKHFEFYKVGDNEWFEFVDSQDTIIAFGYMGLGLSNNIISFNFSTGWNFINPYQEIYVESKDQFWSHILVLQHQDPEEALPTHIKGLVHDYKSEGRITINYHGYKIEGWARNGVLKGTITRYSDNGETLTGLVRNKSLNGLISMHHHPQNFREFKIKPTRTVLMYKEGVPQIDKKVTVFYENGDIEDGLFSSKLSSFKPPRRVLVEGTRVSENLICTGKFDFKTGALFEGEAQYDSHNQDIVKEDLDPTERVICLKEIARGIYPHKDRYKGQWNPRSGVLLEGTITHKDGSIDIVKKGEVVRNHTPSKAMIVPTPRFDEALFQLEKHRKELQQINRKRIHALRLGESKPDYRKALVDKYRDVVGRTHASVRAPLQTFLQQGKTNIVLRKQFMRRLYQDEPYQKQLLEILLRILKLYENDRKNIAIRIRENLKALDKKTLRKNVLPIVMKSLFDDELLREPVMEEMDLIYVPYDGKESLIELIYAMAPKELKLGDDLVKKFQDKKIDELIPYIDDLISTILGNIATHLPMNALQKMTEGAPSQVSMGPEEEEEDAMAYFFLQQEQQQQQPHPKQKRTDIRIDALSWNISWLILKDNPALLSSTIRLLETITLSSDFILLQEIPFDPDEFSGFNKLLGETEIQNLSIQQFHRAVVQPYLDVPGMMNQMHGLMIMARSAKWEIVQRKKPKSYLLRPLISDKGASQRAIVSSMPARIFHTESEIAAEQDLNRQAVWYSTDPMKDDDHEPHLFAKLSTLSGLFRSKTIPSFYMIVMNIHVRKIGYNDYYRKRLLRDINEQIRLYKIYLEKIKASVFGIFIGGDFNRTDYYIITEILNSIPALRGGHVIMNPIPIIGKPPIDGFLIPEHVTAEPQFIEPQWQQAQLQLKTIEKDSGGIFPKGGHTPFNILLTFPLT
jgi:hypothetical protein